jgi:hypothetical protein
VSSASAAALREGLERSHWTTTDLWRAALGIGGDFSTADVDALASGLHDANEVEHDILAAALNDHFSDVGLVRLVPYWAELAPTL